MTLTALRQTLLYWTYSAGVVAEIELGYATSASAEPRTVYPVEVSNIGIPPVTHKTRELPFLPGSVHEGWRYNERVITIGWVARFSTPFQRKTYDATLRTHFQPRDAVGRLRFAVYTDAGALSYQRAIDCRFQGGLEQGMDTLRGPMSGTYVVQLLAPLPYFYDPTGPIDTSVTIGGSTGVGQLPAELPMQLGGSNISGTETFTNDGEVDTWPILTIDGPIYWPRITNTTDSDQPYIEVQYDLGTGEQIIIDCRPGYMSVEDDSGNNLMPYVAVGSEFFTLAPGDNDLLLTASGPGNEADLNAVYSEHYLGV